jgi:hypothetical protein
MSGLHFTPGRKGKLSKLLRNLYYCQTKQQEPPFKGKGFSYTFENDLFVITFKTSGIIEFNGFVGIDYLVIKDIPPYNNATGTFFSEKHQSIIIDIQSNMDININTGEFNLFFDGYKEVIFYVKIYENRIPECNLYNDCGCIQEKVNQIKTGYNDPTQPLSLRVAQLATQRLGGRTTFGNVGIGLGIGVNARTNTFLGGAEGQPGGSPRPIRNRF